MTDVKDVIENNKIIDVFWRFHKSSEDFWRGENPLVKTFYKNGKYVTVLDVPSLKTVIGCKFIKSNNIGSMRDDKKIGCLSELKDWEPDDLSRIISNFYTEFLLIHYTHNNVDPEICKTISKDLECTIEDLSFITDRGNYEGMIVVGFTNRWKEQPIIRREGNKIIIISEVFTDEEQTEDDLKICSAEEIPIKEQDGEDGQAESVERKSTYDEMIDKINKLSKKFKETKEKSPYDRLKRPWLDDPSYPYYYLKDDPFYPQWTCTTTTTNTKAESKEPSKDGEVKNTYEVNGKKVDKKEYDSFIDKYFKDFQDDWMKF